MNKHKRAQKRIWSFILAVVITTTTVLLGWCKYTIKVEAVYNTDKAITYGEFRNRTNVGSKYFFVGTYLFSLDAISDEIYEKALNSQSDMNQYNEYYKSELAGGVWYDIEDATDLTNITVNGTKVDQAKMDKLYVTVYIDPYGKPFDAKTMSPITIYDDPDPYELKTIPELNTLYQQYKSLFSEDSRGVDLFYYEQLKSFFDTDLRKLYPDLKTKTDNLDTRLKNLQAAYEYLQASGKSEEAEAVQKLMERVDNSRRALIYQKLAIGDEADPSVDYELNKLKMILSNWSDDGEYDIYKDKTVGGEIERSTMPYDAWTNSKKQYTYSELHDYIQRQDGLVAVKDDGTGTKVLPDIKSYFDGTKYEGATADKQEFVQNDAIISSIQDADAACKKAYDTYTSDSLATPDSHIGKAVYDREMAIFAAAESGYSASMDQMLSDLVAVNNIASNVVKDKNKELPKVRDELLPACEAGFKSMATGGVANDFKVAVAQGANSDGATSALADQQARLNKEMTELEFVITAYKMRVTTKECFQLTLGWIDDTDALLSSVPSDEFATKAKLAINTHKAWLSDLLEKLVKEDASLQSELDKLKSQKEALNAEKMKALDNNDLNGVKKIDAKLAEIDRRIGEETAKAENTVNNSNSSASEKASAAVGLNGTTAGAIQDIKKDALDKISNGEDASDEIAALSELGADEALKEIADSKDSDSENSDSKNSASNGKDSASLGKNSISSLSENELNSILEDVLGGSFSSLDESGKVVAAVALELAGEAGNDKAKAMAKNYIEICANEKNIYVYDTAYDGATLLVNLNTVGKTTAYRYVYKSSGKEGTLAKGTTSYKFKIGSVKMTISPDNTEVNMGKAPKLKYGSLYISDGTVKEYFNLSAYAIKKASYSAVLNGKMETKAEALLEAFKNGGTQ